MDLLICCNMRKTSESIPAPLPNQNGVKRGFPQGHPATQSRLAGVGIVFHGMPGEGLIVQALTPGGPAERNGQVRIGDLLQTIDGAKVAEMTDRDLAKSLLGQPGSKVVLGMLRPGKPDEDFIELERARPSLQAPAGGPP